MKKIIVIALILCLLLTGCEPATESPVSEEAAPQVTQVQVEQGQVAGEVTPTIQQPTEVPPPLPTPTPEPALPPEPQEISFNAMDGQELKGLFYPAARLNTPVVVLIHWIKGDKSDWYEIAPWLQNRGLKNPFPNPSDEPWWDPTWFPAIGEEISYNVFIFSLRSCLPMNAKGCPKFIANAWLDDVEGAMLKITELEGVDASQVVVIGSSIGADGAADGCLILNDRQPGACQGALSLSPGSYLGMEYAKVVETHSQSASPATIWCLADENEISICKSAGEYPNYQIFEIPGGDHGTMLLSPELTPLPLQLILDFLDLTLGGE